MTFQTAGEVRVDEVPEPVISSADEVIVKVDATGVCGSDPHIYRGRVPMNNEVRRSRRIEDASLPGKSSGPGPR